MCHYFQFGTFETVVSSIVDQYPDKLRRFKIPFTAFVCVVQFVLGFPLVTRVSSFIFDANSDNNSTFDHITLKKNFICNAANPLRKIHFLKK